MLASDGISFTIRNAQLVFRVTNPANYSLHANKANDSIFFFFFFPNANLSSIKSLGFPKIAEGVLSSVLRSMTSGTFSFLLLFMIKTNTIQVRFFQAPPQ